MLAAVFYAEFNTKHSLDIWMMVGLALRERDGWKTAVVWFWVLGFGFWVLGFDGGPQTVRPELVERTSGTYARIL
ncbi:hypothetical protein QN362_00005 [Actimicrobium sp. CCC2.4]|uniref:hypothetical protein n=1 Tax=Actimicrobium sp. CCC2.4 TaxID=3048606 RepID=UPI002AC9DD6E|nr:hypothetical protein [Actimicrobium sp. CCC2.4]MEB0133707.1 hypothetical protein [Actimicrobium sp. CCC2.4]WPX31255.1 hypothetical protein RHM62_13490 [Actimicrobium sp. CCC2.4]